MVRSSFNFRLIAFFCSVASLTLALPACSKAPADAKPTTPSAQTQVAAEPVEVVPVQPADLSESIRVSGMLQANSELTLSFKTGGLIRRIAVEVGQQVKSGDLLAELDLTELSSSTQAMRENVAKAERDYQRAEKLFADDVIPKSQLDDAKTGWDVARAGLRGMAFNTDNGRLTAKAAGTVLRRFADASEVVAPGQPVLSLGQNNGAKIFKVALSDRDALRIKIGDSAEVEFNALPNHLFQAQVRTEAGGANPLSGMFEIELALADDSELARLSSGMIGRANIRLAASSDSNGWLQIPVSALAQAQGSQGEVYLFVAELGKADVGKAELVKIQINSPGSALSQSMVHVVSGLELGQHVIARGTHVLESGQMVKLTQIATRDAIEPQVAQSAVGEHQPTQKTKSTPQTQANLINPANGNTPNSTVAPNSSGLVTPIKGLNP